jgi:transcriptional regulator with XRE-family HTH domain
MAEQSLSVKEAAWRLGVERAYLSRVRHGRVVPGPGLRVRISELTLGRIPYGAWGADYE